MVSEEFVNFIPEDDRLANSRDANPLETMWILVRQHTKIEPPPPPQKKKKTVDEVTQRLRFAWKNVNLDTLW